MKSLLFSISTFLFFSANAFSQDRHCDLSLRVVSPTPNYSVPFGDTIDVVVCIKNNGTDSILRTDTLLIGMAGSNIYSAMLDTIIAPGDSLVWSIMSGYAFPDQEENDTLNTCLFLEHLPYYTDSNPTNDSLCFSVIFEGSRNTSITKLNENNNTTIYPNPSDDIVNISSQNIIKRIALVDILGKTIKIEHPNKTKFTIDIRSLPTSIYFLNMLDSNNKLSTQRIQKQ